MPITALPTAPSRALRPADFANQADAFLSQLPTFAAEATTLEQTVNAAEVVVIAAESSAISAKNAAQAAQAAAEAVAYAEAWAAGKSYTTGQCVFGTDGQTYRAIAASTGVNPVGDATGKWALISAGGLSNSAWGRGFVQSDSAAAARTSLELGTAATEDTIPVANGGTGATTAADARTNLGLGSVATENTVPVEKGGTGATTAADARTNLGLLSAATKSVAVTPVGANDAGKLPALDATGKLPVDFIPTSGLTCTNADMVDGYHASQVANPNTIPVADAAGKLAADWLPAIVPVGSVFYIAGDVIPVGFVRANGGELSRETYHDLFSVVGTIYGVGDGNTTFNVPDLRGQFIRSWDNGRGIDSGRTLGSTQDDAFQTHTHNYEAYESGASSGSKLEWGGSGTIKTFTSTSAGDADETRPKNIALLAIIKY